MADVKTVIIGAVVILIGLILLPVTANFAGLAKTNDSTKNISGMTSIVDIIVYSFTFMLIGVGVGMVYIGIKGTGL